MEPVKDLFSAPKAPKPAKAPPNRADAAAALERDQADKRRALLLRGASGTVFTSPLGVTSGESVGIKTLTGQ